MPDRQLVSHFHTFARISALLTTVISAVVLIGWTIGIWEGRRAGAVLMRPSEALAFALAGLALVLLTVPGGSRWKIALGTLAALLVSLLGLVNLSELAFGWNFSLDDRLIAYRLAMGTAPVRRIDPLTAISFLLLGIALAALRGRSRSAERLAENLALAITPGALLILLSYLAGSPGIRRTDLITPMALASSCVFLLLSVGILAARVEHGWSQMFVLQTPGGRLLRAVLPFIGLLPLVAWIRLEGERALWYSRETGLAFFSLLGVVALAWLLYWASQVIDRAEYERLDAERHYRAVFDNDIHAILIADDSGRYVDANPAACRMYGRSRNEIVGKRIRDFVTPDFDFESAWRNFLKVGYATGEWPVQTPNGIKRTYQYFARANFMPGLHLSALHDITERKRAETDLARARDDLEIRVRERTAQLSKTNEQLREAEGAVLGLSRHLLRLRDEEWRRISRELHDSTGQNLSAALMNLSFVEGLDRGMGDDARVALAESMGLIDQSLCEIRMISYLLHPPLLDERGLASALAWFAEGFERRSGIRVILELPERLGRLPGDIETGIFRIIQECFSNISKYSGSTSASVKLERRNDKVVVEVRDEGTGISPEKLEGVTRGTGAGVGFLGMRERARLLGGSLQIDSNEHGTTVRVVLPVAAEITQAAASS